MKKFISLMLILLLIITPVPVYAEDDFDTALTAYLGHAPTEEEKGTYSLIITTLKAEGCTDYAIAGIIGNLEHESSGALYAIEGYYGSKKTTCGTTCYDFVPGNTYVFEIEPSWSKKGGKTMGGEGHGLLQWSFGRADNLSKLAEEFNHVTVTHWKKSWDGEKTKHTCKIPDLAGQAAFICQELNTSMKPIKDAMNAATSTREAAKIFCQKYEIPYNNQSESVWGPRAETAEKFYPVVLACQGLSGTVLNADGTTSTTTDNADQVATYLIKKGYWTEEQLSSYCRLTEMNMQEILNKASIDNLNSADLSSLDNWKNNIENIEGKSSIVRIIVQFIGVSLLIWAILLFLGFQFDSVNNLIDFSVVNILTLGRLEVAIDDDSTVTKNKEAKVRVISKRNCISICLVTIVFAVLLLTGKFYSILATLVHNILNMFR